MKKLLVFSLVTSLLIHPSLDAMKRKAEDGPEGEPNAKQQKLEKVHLSADMIKYILSYIPTSDQDLCHIGAVNKSFHDVMKPIWSEKARWMHITPEQSQSMIKKDYNQDKMAYLILSKMATEIVNAKNMDDDIKCKKKAILVNKFASKEYTVLLEHFFRNIHYSNYAYRYVRSHEDIYNVGQHIIFDLIKLTNTPEMCKNKYIHELMEPIKENFKEKIIENKLQEYKDNPLIIKAIYSEYIKYIMQTKYITQNDEYKKLSQIEKDEVKSGDALKIKDENLNKILQPVRDICFRPEYDLSSIENIKKAITYYDQETEEIITKLCEEEQYQALYFIIKTNQAYQNEKLAKPFSQMEQLIDLKTKFKDNNHDFYESVLIKFHFDYPYFFNKKIPELISNNNIQEIKDTLFIFDTNELNHECSDSVGYCFVESPSYNEMKNELIEKIRNTGPDYDYNYDPDYDEEHNKDVYNEVRNVMIKALINIHDFFVHKNELKYSLLINGLKMKIEMHKMRSIMLGDSFEINLSSPNYNIPQLQQNLSQIHQYSAQGFAIVQQIQQIYDLLNQNNPVEQEKNKNLDF